MRKRTTLRDGTPVVFEDWEGTGAALQAADREPETPIPATRRQDDFAAAQYFTPRESRRSRFSNANEP